MTHINPDTDTTINPVVQPNKWFLINDIEMREFFNAWMCSSKSPKQLHEVYDPILARELNHLCGYCEKPFDKHNLPCPYLMRTKLGELIVECAHFKPRGPIDWTAHTTVLSQQPCPINCKNNGRFDDCSKHGSCNNCSSWEYAPTPAQQRVDAVIEMLKRWRDCQMIDLTDGSWYSEVGVEKLEEAIALLQAGRK